MYLSKSVCSLLSAVICLPIAATETKDDIIPIWSAAELNTTLRTHPDRNFWLADDIYLNDSKYTPWIPLGSKDNPFNGTLDGGGRVIYGLKVNTIDDNEPAGLFGNLVDSWISHLILSAPSVTSSGSNSPAGALVGMMENSDVADCVGSGVQVQTHAQRSPAGGLVGYAFDDSPISKSVVTGYVKTDAPRSHAGGVVGHAHGGAPVINSIVIGNLGTKGSRSYAGGVVGYAQNNSPVSNSLSTSNVETEGERAHAGGLVGHAHDNSTVRNSLATGSVQTAKQIAHAGGLVGYARKQSAVSNSMATGNTGTNGDDAHAGGLIGYAFNDSPVSNSLATGHLNTTGENAYSGGLVGYAHKSSPVSNSLATGSTSSSGENAHVGGLVGYAYDNSLISGSAAFGKVGTVRANAGGLVGRAQNGSSVSDSLAVGDVDTVDENAHAGGLVGFVFNNSTISNSLATGNVDTDGKKAHAGGLVGYAYNNSPVSKSLATGDVGKTKEEAYAGGLVGYAHNNSPISDSLATGRVRAGRKSNAGGLVGRVVDNSPVNNSASTGSVDTAGTNSHAGGLVGYAYWHCPVSNCLATGDVVTTGSSAHTGGLVGSAYINSPVSNCLATGDVKKTSKGESRIGGLVGSAIRNVSISDCLAIGNVDVVSSDNDIGGLVGLAYIHCPVSNSLAAGNVKSIGDGNLVGGLAGHTSNGGEEGKNPVSNNLVSGNVETKRDHSESNVNHYTGGLVGDAGQSPIENCLVAGHVNSNGAAVHVGGLAGHDHVSPVKNCLIVANVSATGSGAQAGGVFGSSATNGKINNVLFRGSVFEPRGTPDAPYYPYTKVSAEQLRDGPNGLNEPGSTFWNPGTIDQFPIPTAVNPAYQDLQRLNSTVVGLGRFPGVFESFALPGGILSSLFDPAQWVIYSPGLAFIPRAINPAYQDLKRLNGTDAGHSFFPEVLEGFASPGNSSASMFDWLTWSFQNADRFPIPYAINPAYQDLKRLNGTLNGTLTFPEVLNKFAQLGNASESLFDPEYFNTEDGYLPFLRWVNRKTALDAGIDCNPGGVACSPDEPEPVFSFTTEVSLPSSSPTAADPEEQTSLQPSQTPIFSPISPVLSPAARGPSASFANATTDHSAAVTTEEPSSTQSIPAPSSVSPLSSPAARGPSASFANATTDHPAAVTTEEPSSTQSIPALATSSVSPLPSPAARGPSASFANATTDHPVTVTTEEPSSTQSIPALATSSVSPLSSPAARGSSVKPVTVATTRSAVVTKDKPSSLYTQVVPTSEATPLTTQSTEPAAEKCPPASGSPVFQTWDPENGFVYVVRQPTLGTNFALIRYRGTELDSDFGSCGVQEFTLEELENSYDITAGVLIYRDAVPHLYLTVSTVPVPLLLELVPGSQSATLTVHQRQTVAHPAQRFNTMIADSNGTLVAAGVTDDRSGETGAGQVIGALLGEFVDNKMRALIGSGWARDVSLSEDEEYLFMVGMENNRVFLRKKGRRSRFFTDTSFANEGEQTVYVDITFHSQQAVLVHQSWVYVASNNDSDQSLLIRRFDSGSGEPDGSFLVDEATPGFSRNTGSYRKILPAPVRRARVVLIANNGYLHVLKYGREGHIFAASYNIEKNNQSNYRLDESPNFDDVADYGQAVTDGRVYLAFESGGNGTANTTIQIYEVPLPDLTVAEESPRTLPSGYEGLIWGVTGTVLAVALVGGGMGCLLVKNKHSKK